MDVTKTNLEEMNDKLNTLIISQPDINESQE